MLSKQSTSELHHDSGAARQKQLKNAQAQHAAILKEVEGLRQQAAQSSVDKRIQLEEEVSTLQQKIKETANSNKEKQRQVHEAEKKIEGLIKNPEDVKEIRLLNEELRVQKEKLRELEVHYEHAKKQSEQAQKKITQLESEASSSGIQIQNRITQKKTVSDEVEPTPVRADSQDVKNLKEEITELERKKKTDESTRRKKLTEIENEFKNLAKQKEELTKVLKEKEQECRIKDYEIKELRRRIRSLQLKGNQGSAPEMNLESDEKREEGPESWQPEEVTPSPNLGDPNEKSVPSDQEDLSAL